MATDTICEPIEVDPLRLVRIARVRRSGPVAAPERFAHFHDVAELVWFGQVNGQLVTAEGSFALAPGTAVFLPPMHQHDFVIGPGPHDWIVVHVDPAKSSSPGDEPGLPRPDRAIVVHGDSPHGPRIAMLFSWLAELGETGADHRAAASLLVNLIRVALADATPAASQPTAMSVAPIDRLRPALDRIARDPAAALSLSQAAALCNLSDSYFSRRFKAVFDTNFTDYVRSYRLRLAARRLLTSGARVARIGYDTGFATPAHFTAAFRARYGVAPRAYRARASANIPDAGQIDDSF